MNHCSAYNRLITIFKNASFNHEAGCWILSLWFWLILMLLLLVISRLRNRIVVCYRFWLNLNWGLCSSSIYQGVVVKLCSLHARIICSRQSHWPLFHHRYNLSVHRSIFATLIARLSATEILSITLNLSITIKYFTNSHIQSSCTTVS